MKILLDGGCHDAGVNRMMLSTFETRRKREIMTDSIFRNADAGMNGIWLECQLAGPPELFVLGAREKK
jgi:hypothetical protein